VVQIVQKNSNIKLLKRRINKIAQNHIRSHIYIIIIRISLRLDDELSSSLKKLTLIKEKRKND